MYVPNNTSADIHQKVDKWFANGCFGHLFHASLIAPSCHNHNAKKVKLNWILELRTNQKDFKSF
jgi:hypothetical protein